MWQWVKSHAFLIGLGLFGLIGVLWALFGRGTDKPKMGDLVTKLSLEKQVIDAKAKVRKMTAMQGHAVAAAQIKKDNEEKIAAMDEADQKKVEELADDPEALVDYVLRTTA